MELGRDFDIGGQVFVFHGQFSFWVQEIVQRANNTPCNTLLLMFFLLIKIY